MREAASLGGTGVGLTAELEILDSGDTPASAVTAANAAVAAGAKMLIGPLFSEQARAVVAAVPRGVPVVAMSNDTTLADAGVYVFGITPLHSAQAVLSLAAGRGLRDIAIVVPPGEFGKRSIEAANSLAGTLGITLRAPVVTGSASGLVASIKAAGNGSLPSAVYLPDAGPELDGFARALAGTGVQILGSTQWSSKDLTGKADFNDAWFAAPDPLRFEPFARALAQRVKAPAGILAGLAFDGAEMARLLGRTGDQTARGLQRDKGFSGVLGPYRFLKTRLCQRGLAVLKISDGGTTLIGATSV